MQCFNNVNSTDSWASAWPSRPFWLNGHLVFLWPSWLDDTSAGGLMPQFVMTPTIRTHCFLRWGQTPVLKSESGRWLCTGGLLPLDTNKLETPSGDYRCRGLLLHNTQSLDVRGSFYWTPTSWAHPRVATTVGGSFHWTLGHLTYLFVSFSISQEFLGTAVNHHRRSPGFFKMVLGGACTYAKPSGPGSKTALSTPEWSIPRIGLVNIYLDASAHQPP